MADHVRRAAAYGFHDFGDVNGQIVQTCAVKGAAALSNTAHVDRDGLQPSGSEHSRQLLKIPGAAAAIREQNDRNAGPVQCAFERRAADFDVSMLLQSYLDRK